MHFFMYTWEHLVFPAPFYGTVTQEETNSIVSAALVSEEREEEGETTTETT